MRIWISKGSVLLTLILLIGIYIFYNGAVAQNKYRESVTFEELTTDDYAYGTYVVGEIKDFVKTFSGKYPGICSEIGNYKVHTVALQDGKYVPVYISDRQIMKQLEKACYDSTETIFFEGILMKPDGAPNYDWYKASTDLEPEDIVTEFVVKQTSKKSIINRLVLGGEIIVICVLLRLTGIVGRVYTLEEREDDRQKRRPTKHYNPDSSLHSEEKRLERIHQQILQLRKDFYISLPFMVVGLCILIVAPFAELKMLGIPLIIYAGKEIVLYILNLPNEKVRFLAHLFGVKPLYEKRQECEETIAALRQSMEVQQPIIMQEPFSEPEELESE